MFLCLLSLAKIERMDQLYRALFPDPLNSGSIRILATLYSWSQNSLQAIHSLRAARLFLCSPTKMTRIMNNVLSVSFLLKVELLDLMGVLPVRSWLL